MSIEICSGYLEVMESLNQGVDHACLYQLSRMEDGESLRESLQSELKKRHSNLGGLTLEIMPLGSAWKTEVTSLVKRWFFEQQYSPPASSTSAQKISETFVEHIESALKNGCAFEVIGEAAMLMNIVWEAVAFTVDQQHWLLEFGWSD